MSSVLLLNQSNATNLNNVFNYKFPSGSVNFQNMEVAISQIILPYSWYNITSSYNNQKLNIIFPDDAGTVNISITIPQGFYTIQQINQYLQSIQLQNGYALINAAGSIVYYIEIVANSNTGLAQLNCYDVPTSLPSGYSYYSGGKWGSIGLPTNANQVPQLVVASTNNFGTLIGFSAGTFPSSATQSSTYSIQSTTEPVISNVTCVSVGISLVNNVLSSPSNIAALIPITSTWGSQINYQPNELLWLPVLNGTTNNFSVYFYDQNSNNLGINDTEITICLIIRKKN